MTGLYLYIYIWSIQDNKWHIFPAFRWLLMETLTTGPALGAPMEVAPSAHPTLWHMRADSTASTTMLSYSWPRATSAASQRLKKTSMKTYNCKCLLIMLWLKVVKFHDLSSVHSSSSCASSSLGRHMKVCNKFIVAESEIASLFGFLNFGRTLRMGIA